MRRRQFTLAAGIALLAAMVVWGWPAIDLFVLHRKIYVAQPAHDGYTMGFAHMSRLSGEVDGPQIIWHVRTGMIAAEAEVHDGRQRLTLWDADGRVFQQLEGLRTRGRTVARAPPWLWGAADQTAPSAPWLEAGLTPSEWWCSVEPRHGRYPPPD